MLRYSAFLSTFAVFVKAVALPPPTTDQSGSELQPNLPPCIPRPTISQRDRFGYFSAMFLEPERGLFDGLWVGEPDFAGNVEMDVSHYF